MDIGRALTYFSEDERWVEKTAIGTGLLLISSLLLVALIGVFGLLYPVRLPGTSAAECARRRSPCPARVG